MKSQQNHKNQSHSSLGLLLHGGSVKMCTLLAPTGHHNKERRCQSPLLLKAKVLREMGLRGFVLMVLKRYGRTEPVTTQVDSIDPARYPYSCPFGALRCPMFGPVSFSQALRIVKVLRPFFNVGLLPGKNTDNNGITQLLPRSKRKHPHDPKYFS